MQAKVQEHSGPGCEWHHTFPEGDTTASQLVGPKPLEVVEDEIRELPTWWWNGKDYLEKRAKAVGKSPQAIDDMVKRACKLAVRAHSSRKDGAGVEASQAR
mgnify:CR=1 FL=1